MGPKNNLGDRNQRLHLPLRVTLAHRFPWRKHAQTRVRLGPNHFNWEHSCHQRFTLLLEELLESYRLNQETFRAFLHRESKKRPIFRLRKINRSPYLTGPRECKPETSRWRSIIFPWHHRNASY